MLSMICRELTDVIIGEEPAEELNNGEKIVDTSTTAQTTAEDEWLKERHRTFFTQHSLEEEEEEDKERCLSWSTDAIPDMDDFMDVTHLIPYISW